MKKITIATFNCENLFRRFKFSSQASPEKIEKAIKNGFIIDRALFEIIPDTEKAFTAKAILDCKADIMALVEIENLDTLKDFVSTHLKNKGYKYNLLIDGNDPRFIDVAFISKIPFDYVITHQYIKSSNKKDFVFSRDCLEVKFTIDGEPLYLFINHFKSMFDKKDPKNGRKNTASRRKEQARAVVNILKSRFGDDPGNSNWIVLGDLNDYPSSDSSLNVLLDNPWIDNIIFTRLPDSERWTHYWDKSSVPVDERYKQLDYILLSKKLAEENISELPVIIRKGLCLNASRYDGYRYPGIGKSRPAASDHCPIDISLKI
jgi:predicted extracellular nuclease